MNSIWGDDIIHENRPKQACLPDAVRNLTRGIQNLPEFHRERSVRQKSSGGVRLQERREWRQEDEHEEREETG